ncbi:unnamed protein product [Tetraodon nigroviridis]|uniref:(spotted green pufferfish) hypothetical protein n=1 Tax=Tetraodon nigroviridis TaxID=99883 RepID=Q4S3P4_TETNG|nr:unnamed protein product [Tetraodon nigroviridis]
MALTETCEEILLTPIDNDKHFGDTLPSMETAKVWEENTSRCVAEKKYTEQQAKKLFPQVFVPVCNPDGTYSEVQCHSYTGYCWCVTPNGRPISGSAVANKKPRCQGSKQEKVTTREPGKTVSLQIFSILNADETGLVVDPQPAADEEDISQYPTLWTEQTDKVLEKNLVANRTESNEELNGMAAKLWIWPDIRISQEDKETFVGFTVIRQPQM